MSARPTAMLEMRADALGAHFGLIGDAARHYGWGRAIDHILGLSEDEARELVDLPTDVVNA